MPTVQLSEYVKSELDTLKDERDHTSYDSTVRELLLLYQHSQPYTDVDMVKESEGNNE